MPIPALSAIVATAAHSVTRAPADTDGELLQQFVRTGEEPAFGALVRRLGPMVLGVCRRVSGDSHLAEDAFQAAFVVLARRAADVRPAEAVRAWLYGVAVRTARGVRAVTARRLAREVPVPAVPDRAGEVVEQPDADTLAILDEEVAGLPEHLRAAVVLCELDGLSRKDAAKRLGVAEGTLSSRLAKARKLLASQLKKRGVAMPMAGLGMLVTSANVSARLVARTSAMATAVAPLPAAVAALSNGVFRTMFFQKLTIGTMCGLLLALAGFAAWAHSPDAVAQEPPKQPVRLVVQAQADDKKPVAAKPAGPGTLVVGREGSFSALTPDGKKVSEVDLPVNTQPHGHAALSPDGKRLASIEMEITPLSPDNIDKPLPIKVGVRNLDKPDNNTVWDVPAMNVTALWTADGKKLIVSHSKTRERGDCETMLLDPDTGKTDKSDIPAGLWALESSKDGKTLLVQGYDAKTKKDFLGTLTPGDKEPTKVCELRHRGTWVTTARLSPDGKTVLLIDADPEQKDAHKWGCSRRIYTIDLATKKRELLPDFPENGQAYGIAWSPDGKKVAYTWQGLDAEALKKDQLSPEDVTKETEGFLMIADANGKNATTVTRDKGKFSTNRVLGPVDWK